MSNSKNEERTNQERRKHPRVFFEDTHSVNILAEPTTPIDLSATGVLLEVSRPLSGAVNHLRLDLGPGREIDLQGRVIRCVVHHFEQCEDGKTILKYRVAIEFVNLEEDVRQILQSYIGSAAWKEIAENLGAGVTYEGLDQRSERRIEANSVRTGQVAFLMDFDLLQLSVGGMLVSLAVPLPVGSLHPFVLTVDGRHLEVQGEVLNCKSHTDGESSIGHKAAIKFHGLSENDRELLEQYVLQTLGERGVAELQESV